MTIFNTAKICNPSVFDHEQSYDAKSLVISSLTHIPYLIQLWCKSAESFFNKPTKTIKQRTMKGNELKHKKSSALKRCNEESHYRYKNSMNT